MSGRRRGNQLPTNLPQLQNLIKRDPESYGDEFNQQLQHFRAQLQIFLLRPNEYSKDLDELLIFLAQVSHCYPTHLKDYPKELMEILEKYSMVLEPEIRLSMCRSLILMRNKNLLEPTALIALFFRLLHSQDKNLRKFLETHIMTDIKNVNAKHKNVKLNTVLQNFMFEMIRDSNVKATKMSLSIMIELYRKNIWNDPKTVNVIVTACFSKVTKIMVAALQFFLNPDESGKGINDSDSEDDLPNAKDVIMANRVNKKTRKRDKNLTKVKAVIKKKKNKNKAPNFNFSALHLIHDPQGMAEKLFKQVESMNERFEVKIMTLDLISRLIGTHQLILLNFYPYLKKFLQPHQRDVTKILQYIAQASHDLVPPDVIEPVVRTIVDNFVTERNSGEVMAVGLNAVREICNRCPLVMSRDILQDLTEYKSYKDKAVMMAAKTLIHTFRDLNPQLLQKKDKGKPTVASLEKDAKQFGEIDSRDFVAGAEILVRNEEDDGDSGSDSGDESDSDGEWVNVSQSDDDKEDEGSEEEVEGDESTSENPETVPKEGLTMDPAARKALAAEITLSKILTDEDFKRIEAHQLQKEVMSVRKGSAKKRKAETPLTPSTTMSELVDLSSIEMIHKKRKHDRDSRMETVLKGREGRDKFGRKRGRMNPHASTTDKEKKKNKPFMMVRNKLKKTKKRSFKEQQSALRKSLLKQKKNIK